MIDGARRDLKTESCVKGEEDEWYRSKVHGVGWGELVFDATVLLSQGFLLKLVRGFAEGTRVGCSGPNYNPNLAEE